MGSGVHDKAVLSGQTADKQKKGRWRKAEVKRKGWKRREGPEKSAYEWALLWVELQKPSCCISQEAYHTTHYDIPFYCELHSTEPTSGDNIEKYCFPDGLLYR
jgi:hypothetical protein